MIKLELYTYTLVYPLQEVQLELELIIDMIEVQYIQCKLCLIDLDRLLQ